MNELERPICLLELLQRLHDKGSHLAQKDVGLLLAVAKAANDVIEHGDIQVMEPIEQRTKREAALIHALSPLVSTSERPIFHPDTVKAGRLTDDLVLKAVPEFQPPGGSGASPKPSTSLEDAVRLIKVIERRGVFMSVSSGRDEFWAQIGPFKHAKSEGSDCAADALAPTIPLAICRAVLKAQQAKALGTPPEA